MYRLNVTILRYVSLRTVAINKGDKNKKDVRLVALRPSICRHRQTPWPNELWRNNIPTPWYIRGQCAERTLPAYTQNEHWLLRSLVLNFGEFTNWNLNKMLSCVSGFLPTGNAKVIYFFLQSMLFEYYFFKYKRN